MILWKYIRFSCVLLYTFILLSSALILSLLTLQLFAVKLWYYTGRMWGKGSLWLLGIRLHEENKSTFPDRAARIVMLNHESLLDIFWLCAICPPTFASVTKDLFRYIPLVNITFWLSGQIFINRSNRKQAVDALNTLLNKVHAKKKTVVIAPEGTRTTTGELLALKKGGFYMAIQGKLPVHIVLASRPFDLMPPKQLYSHYGTISIRYLPVLDTSNWSISTIEDHMNVVHTLMKQHLNEMHKSIDSTL